MWYVFALPSILFRSDTSSVLLDRDGHLLAAGIATDGQWRFPGGDTIPLRFEQSLLEFEDRHFHSHWGVHLPSILRAAYQNWEKGRIVSGGSTISMQVIRLSRNNPPRSIWEKGIEMLLATRLEWGYSKREILELYCENAPFGGNVVGLEAASWRFFGRAPSELSWAESATLAVLPNAPALIFPGRNQESLLAKRNRLLDRLHQKGIITTTDWELAKLEPVPGQPHPLPQHALHLLFSGSSEKKEKRLKSTLAKEIQVLTEQIIQRHAARLEANQVYNAAAIVVHVPSGEVQAYVGNIRRSNKQHGEDVDLVKARRSTGSILKPFLHAAMLDKGELLPNMLLADIPTRLGNFNPDNFSLGFDGAISASKALSRSLNVPAVRALNDFGVEKFRYILGKLGLTNIDKPAKHYGLSLVLGGAESNLWDLSRAYASLSRSLLLPQGPHVSDTLPWLYQRVLDEPSALPEEASAEAPIAPGPLYLTWEALLNLERPNEESGWDNFTSSRKIAWKTGTSFGFRDAWAIGSTPDYVVAVWVGNASGEGRPGLTGVASASPIMFDIFDALPGTSWFPVPYDDLEKTPVCQYSGQTPSSFCPEIDTAYIPWNRPVLTKPCSYHQQILRDVLSGKRVSRDCLADNKIRPDTFFVLPPLQAWYFKKRNAWYENLPDWLPECRARPSGFPIQLITELPSKGIFLPMDLDGKPSSLVLEAAHNKAESTLYWYLGEFFLGSTSAIHNISCKPPEGNHRLIVMDEEGNLLEKELRIRRR